MGGHFSSHVFMEIFKLLKKKKANSKKLMNGKVLLMRTSNREKPIKRWKSVFCKPWKMFYFGAEG